MRETLTLASGVSFLWCGEHSSHPFSALSPSGQLADAERVTHFEGRLLGESAAGEMLGVTAEGNLAWWDDKGRVLRKKIAQDGLEHDAAFFCSIPTAKSFWKTLLFTSPTVKTSFELTALIPANLSLRKNLRPMQR